MRFLIPLILLLLGLAGGVGAGFVLAPESPAAEVGDAAPDPQPGNVPDPAEGAAEGALVSPASATTEYVRLRNQFIVPVVRDGTVRSLVILSLTVEASTGGNDAVFLHEPRLRDSFLRVLFAHANAGGFDGTFTEASAMAPLRAALREAAIAVLGSVARDVLIVDMTRQDA